MIHFTTSLLRKAKCFPLLIVFTAAYQLSFAQSNKAIDSLMNILKTAVEDTNKVNALNDLSGRLRSLQKFDESKKIATEALTLADQLKFKKGMATAYNNIGLATGHMGNLPEGLKNQQAALKIWEEIGDKRGIADTYAIIGANHAARGLYAESIKYYRNSLQIKEAMDDDRGIADSYNSLGVVYKEMGNYPEALRYLLASLKIREEKGEKSPSAAYNNIGNVYRNLGNYPEALKNLQTAKKIYEENGNKRGAAGALINIGNVLSEQGDCAEALKNYRAALKVFEETGSKGGIAVAYANIGAVYMNLFNFSEALNNYLSALTIFEELKRKDGIAESHMGIGRVFIELNRNSEAKQHLLNCLTLAKEMGAKAMIRDAYAAMSKLDSAMGNYQQALVHHKLYTDYKDSLLNETNSKQIALMKEQYDSEKKDKEIVQLESDKQKLESEKQISALLLKTKQDSLSIVQSENDKVQLENDKVRLENEKIQALNLYNQQQIELLRNEKKLQQLQIEKDKADYAVQKADADKKQEQLVILNKEKAIQELQLKKQKQAKNYFIAGLVLFAVLSFFIYRNYHTRQKLKLLTLRNKIASDLHDDVGSTLSSISIFSQMALEESKEVKPMLQTIGDSSRKMLDAMADIVWTIKPENDQFEKIIMRMRSFAYELLGARQIEFRFTADHNVANLKLSMEARRNLYLIFKEATNNMVKYANASKAMFSVEGKEDKLVMMIQDNGKGFDSNKETQGNGLKNMKKRASEMGAVLQIDSIPGSGTTIQLELAV